MRGYTMNKDDYTKRLRRIEGQVRGIERMIDEDTYCIDVLTQVSAATKALQAVAVGLLDEHVRHCVKNAVADGDPSDPRDHGRRGHPGHRAPREGLTVRRDRCHVGNPWTSTRVQPIRSTVSGKGPRGAMRSAGYDSPITTNPYLTRI